MAQLRNPATSGLRLDINVRMNTQTRGIMRWPLTSSAVYPSPLRLTWRQISSLSAALPPQTLGHKALPGPSCRRLTHVLSGPGDNRASQQGLFSTSSLRPPTTNPNLLLLRLFEDLVPRGLLPQVTAEPSSSAATGHEPAWTVTVSLQELGIEVKGHGSSIVFAEVAAAIQFDLVLKTPEVVTKLPSWPQTQLSLPGAKDIIQSYWQFAHGSRGALKKAETKLDSGAFEASTFAGNDQIGDPVTSAVKDSARGIKDLTLAHQIISGHPGLWPISPGNPFQASIVFDPARLEKLQHLITAATDYLRTTPGQLVGGKQRGAFHKVKQEGEFGLAPRRDVPDFESWLAALPFPPSRSKMLLTGASIRCLEHAIILAAMEKHMVHRKTASPSEEDDGGRDPAFRNLMAGDHPDLLLLFQRLRDAKWFTKKQRRIPKTEEQGRISKTEDCESSPEDGLTPTTDDPLPDHESRQASPNDSTEPAETSSTKNAAVARRFDHFDPDGIASVSASAEAIERSMVTAGLASYPKATSYISVPESKLQIRAEPYGGDLSRTAYRNSLLRHLLVLGFPENIAQIGHGTLAPGQPPQLRIGSRQVYVDSPLKAHMPQKQLYKTLRAGPMMVVTGMTENPQDSGHSARHCTPISTWEAALLGKDLKLPGDEGAPVTGVAQVLVNNWLPVLLKSEVPGVSHEQARETLFEARDALRRAIDKAAFDYVKYSWQSLDFYQLLTGLPNEDSFAAKAVPKELREGPQPRRQHPSRKQT